MNILLDTNILIWLAQGEKRLEKIYQEYLKDFKNSVFFSPTNLQEIAVLNSLKRLKPCVHTSIYRKNFIDAGYKELQLTPNVYDIYEALPLHHRDPFDRFLIAQAIAQNCSILTSDVMFEKYDIDVIRS